MSNEPIEFIVSDIDGVLCDSYAATLETNKRGFKPNTHEYFQEWTTNVALLTKLDALPPISANITRVMGTLIAPDSGAPRQLLFMTARSVRLRSVTEAWLRRYVGVQVPLILMRPEADELLPGNEAKKKQLGFLRAQVPDARFVLFDDDPLMEDFCQREGDRFYRIFNKCFTCNGEGRVASLGPCSSCNGTGHYEPSRKPLAPPIAK